MCVCVFVLVSLFAYVLLIHFYPFIINSFANVDNKISILYKSAYGLCLCIYVPFFLYTYEHICLCIFLCETSSCEQASQPTTITATKKPYCKYLPNKSKRSVKSFHKTQLTVKEEWNFCWYCCSRVFSMVGFFCIIFIARRA